MMGVEDIVEIIQLIWEDIDEICKEDDVADLGEYILAKKYISPNRFSFKLLDRNGNVLGYIESDGVVFYQVIGLENWENFIDWMGW